MTLRSETRPLGVAGIEKSSLLGGENFSEPKPSSFEKQATVCPIVAASIANMQGDLLAESLEFAIAFATGTLRAIREADDPAILQNFHGFDTSARTARACATELRALLEARGAAP